MTISVSPSTPDAASGAHLLFAFSDQAPDMSAFGPVVASALSGGIARRKGGDITPVLDGDALVLIVGLGKSGDFEPADLKRAAGAAVRFLKTRGITAASTAIPAIAGFSEARAAALIVSGAALGAYDAGLLKSGEKDAAFEALTLVSGGEGVAEAAERARIVAEAANFTRDLVNTPANLLPPLELAKRAAEAGRAAGLDVDVLDEAQITAQKMEGILAVAKGSRQPPAFVVLKHMPNAGQPPIVLVGKGVTFDTGGISIKPGADMDHMKGDMGGAGAVAGAMKAIGELNLPVNVVGLIATVENMPDGMAFRPSDVITYANGKTVEVLNTDAEGRLILADGLIYGEREFAPSAMLDLATLTGACVVALGGDIAGIFTSNDALANALLEASATSTEPAWRMPLYKPYRKKFDSGTADMANVGDRWGGAITAALFLAEFVEKTPWAHLDIAGPAFEAKDSPHMSGGGTGYGVALLVEYLTGVVSSSVASIQ